MNMSKLLSVLLVAGALTTLAGCAGKAAKADAAETPPERNFNAPSLQVTSDSKAHEVIPAIPLESLMERFETYDAAGRLINYVAFTDTATGGLVFVDGKLFGALSRQHAQAFYICRGHVMGIGKNYWASEAGAWLETLLAHTRQESAVLLEFTGRSTMQSIKAATENPLLGGLKSIIGMGTNPLKVIRTLNSARDQYQASEQFEAEARGLAQLRPGMNEQRLAAVVRPQDLLFVEGGMVLSYPGHRIDYFVASGSIRLIQQPSFYFLSRTNAALFYAPGARWEKCTAGEWPQALLAEENRAAERGPAATVATAQ
ncbi:MAG: hypothetical protein KUL75_10320 [Sterolibacterium sp.]|nr:hypothetical protein [Sterolibacterium sp.]